MGHHDIEDCTGNFKLNCKVPLAESNSENPEDYVSVNMGSSLPVTSTVARTELLQKMGAFPQALNCRIHVYRYLAITGTRKRTAVRTNIRRLRKQDQRSSARR